MALHEEGLQLTPKGYERRVVGAAAVGLVAIPRAKYALIVCEGNAVRWRDDDTNPTATDGIPLEPGGILQYDALLEKLKFIRSGAADGTLHVSYYA